MTEFPLKKVLLFLTAVAACAAVQGESIAVSDLQKTTGAVLRWDPFRNRGMLVKDERIIGFGPGIPFLVFNYEKMETVSPVTAEKGKLVFPEDAAVKIKAFFADPVPRSRYAID